MSNAVAEDVAFMPGLEEKSDAAVPALIPTAAPAAPAAPSASSATAVSLWRKAVLLLGLLCASLLGLTLWLKFSPTASDGGTAPAGATAPETLTTPPGPQITAARFVKRDDRLGGNWKKELGKDGYVFYNRNGQGQHEQKLPEYMLEAVCSGADSHVFAVNNDDARGLQDHGNGPSRYHTCQFSGNEFSISLRARRMPTYRLAIYCLDYDRLDRKQRVDILAEDKVLHTLEVEKMGEGTWLHYEITGSVDLRLINLGPHNAVLAGIFFDDAGVKMVPGRKPLTGAPPSGEQKLQPGLIAEFFDSINSFANSLDKPTTRRVAGTLRFGVLPAPTSGQGVRNWPLAGACAAVFSGFIKIPKDGKYVFFSESDDGSKLYIDGALLVNNDGNHAMLEKSGEVELTAGLHRLWVEYYNVGGGMGLNVSCQPAGGAKQPLDSAQLFHDPAE